MPYSFIKYKDKDILYVDHKGLAGDKLLNSIKEVTQYILNNKKEVIYIADFTDANGSREVFEYLKSDEVKSAQKYYLRQAIVGLSGIKKMMMNVYSTLTNSGTAAFNTLDEAKEYVVK